MVYWSNDSGFLQNATFVFMKNERHEFYPSSVHLFTFSQSNLYPLPDQKNFPSMPIWIIGSKRSIVVMFLLYFRENNNYFHEWLCPQQREQIYISSLPGVYILPWFNKLTSYTAEAINYHKKLTKWPKKYKKTIPIIMKSFLLVFIIFLTCVSSKSRFIIDGFN